MITITKRGKPVARLVPLAVENPRKLFGCFAGHVAEEGDIVSPTARELGAPLLTRDDPILHYAAQGHLRASPA